MSTPQHKIGSGFRAADARSGVRDYATDPDQAARLWTLSTELTGVNAFV